VKIEFAKYVLHELSLILQKQDFALIAIDGRCGAGKTTLAKDLQAHSSASVVHMDHFYPRMEQRTAERLDEPGGNVDRERFLIEVMEPLKKREVFSYRPYYPPEDKYLSGIEIRPSSIVIIEGAYSCHPDFFDEYDLSVFLTVKMHERLQRIKERNGEAGLTMFMKKWIPMEEKYFHTFDIQKNCNLCFDTSTSESA